MQQQQYPWNTNGSYATHDFGQSVPSHPITYGCNYSSTAMRQYQETQPWAEQARTGQVPSTNLSNTYAPTYAHVLENDLMPSSGSYPHTVGWLEPMARPGWIPQPSPTFPESSLVSGPSLYPSTYPMPNLDHSSQTANLQHPLNWTHCNPWIATFGGQNIGPGTYLPQHQQYVPSSDTETTAGNSSPESKPSPVLGGRDEQASERDAEAQALLNRRPRIITTKENASMHCQHCGRGFRQKHTLRKHVNTLHAADREVFLCDCPGCGETFCSKRDLARHQSSAHASEKKFKCPLCDGLFTRKDNLQRHISRRCAKQAGLQRQSPYTVPTGSCTNTANGPPQTGPGS